MATPTFGFEVTATDNTVTTFTVESLEGEERISQPFEYRLTLHHSNPDLEFSKVVNQEALLTMEQDALDVVGVPGNAQTLAQHVPTLVNIRGIVARFCITERRPDGVACEAVLVPKLERLRMSRGSRLFSDLSTQEIVEEVLKAGGLGSSDYEFRLTKTYPDREHCMQYRESDLDFIQRLLEYEGIYYFFDGGKLIFSDARPDPEVAGRKGLRFDDGTGALTAVDDRIYRFVYTEQIVPEKVRVQDYDFESFEQQEEVEQPTDVSMSSVNYARVGTHYEHGRYAVDERAWRGQKSDDEGVAHGSPPPSTTPAAGDTQRRTDQIGRVALVRAEELEAQRQVVEATSNASRIQPGHTFTLDLYFRASLNGDYLVTAVRHTYDGTTYENTFACIPASVQYRPPRVTPVPRVPGIMTAKVKGTGADDPAYLDEEGRYRVDVPFAPQPTGATEPSRPVRLAQPYAGKDYGLHFPNRADTEMVFACLDGDPDRPLGLGTVPNPWTHTPAPSAKNKLGSQNPVTKGPKSEITFDEKKNVIKTHLGHQLVMDDSDGSGNVGITLQAGKSENSAGRNVYWGSKLELGGYREKSSLEIALDSASHVIGWVNAAFSRNYPALAGELAGLIASQVTTDNYLDDTYGTTTPVGANLFSKKEVTVHGKDGVNIISPNLFGMFSSDLILGPDSDDPRSYLEAIAKFVMNTIWQDVMNDAADEALGTKEKYDEYKAKGKPNPKLAAAFQHEQDLKKKRISELIFTLLQRSGVTVSSAGELKLASVQATNIAAGQGGFGVKSYGSIEQKADLSVAIESHEGIKLSTKGKPYEGDGVIALVKELGDKFPMLGRLLAKLPSQRRISQPFKPKPEDAYPILLENEEGNILLKTGPADVMAHADDGGSVLNFADKGFVHGWSGDTVVFEVGDRKGLSDEAFLAPLESAKVKGRLHIAKKLTKLYNENQILLQTVSDQSSQSSIKIDKGDEIEIKCGQASIVMKKNGDITFKGMNINIEGTADVKVNGKNITSEAKMNHKVTGLKVISEAKAQNEMKGPMTKIDAKGIAMVKGPMIKVG
jgi:Rhs element Vgr protein